MVNDVFIEINEIHGESQDAEHPGAIEVISWSWDIQQSAQYLSGSGGGASKATVGDLKFIHRIDRASPNLCVYCYQGKHIDQAKLTVRKAGGVPFEYFRITMSDVVITGVHPAGGSDMAIETISLSFTKMTQVYFPQSKAGGSMGAVTGVIDLRQFRQG